MVRFWGRIASSFDEESVKMAFQEMFLNNEWHSHSYQVTKVLNR